MENPRTATTFSQIGRGGLVIERKQDLESKKDGSPTRRIRGVLAECFGERISSILSTDREVTGRTPCGRQCPGC